jgi:hypothetical protein
MKASSFKWLQPSFAALFRWRHIQSAADLSARFWAPFKVDEWGWTSTPKDVMIVTQHFVQHTYSVIWAWLSQSACNLWCHAMIPDGDYRLPLCQVVSIQPRRNSENYLSHLQIPPTACASSSSLGIEAYGHPRLHFRLVKKHLQLPITSTLLSRF